MSERNYPHEVVPDGAYEDQGERDPDAPFNAGDPVSVRQRAKSAKQQEQIDKAAEQAVVRNIMGTAHGRSWMAKKLVFCDMYSGTFPNTDQIEMAYRVGLRRVGQHLLEEVCDACPERYAQMRQEMKK